MATRFQPRKDVRQRPLARPVEHYRAAPVERPEPLPAAIPDDDIQVQHDRHQHHAAEQVAANVVYMQYDRRGRVILPPAMKGSHEILLHQNEMADLDGLNRVQDDNDLDDMRETRLLVPLPAIAGLQTDERLPPNRRYCRPWTAEFLTALARAHYAKFHTALQVNSAVRTIEVQERLLLTNGNAAPAEGETASPHLTGQAIDLSKRGLSMTEIAWLRGYLLPLVQSGKVDVEEEFQQACFHISVYRKYMPQPATPRNITPNRHVAAALATAMR